MNGKRVLFRPIWLLVFPAVLFFQGCNLLFVAQGKTSFKAAPAGDIPTADSLSKQMNRAVVLNYIVEKGDKLDFIAQLYYSDVSGKKKLAKENSLKRGAPLKAGRVLRIVEPVFYPSPEEIRKKRETYQSTAQATSTPSIKPSRSPSPVATLIAEEKDITIVPRPKTNLAFAPGEKFTYEVKALGVVAGFAGLEVGDCVKVEGRPCYPLIAKAKSAFPFSTVYTVDDVQTSYFDTVDFFTWKYESKVVEGGYRAHNVELFRQLKHKMVRQHNEETPEESDIPSYTQDIISCFYYFRLLPAEEGKNYVIPASASGKNYKLLVKVLGREKIKVGAGTFDCLKVKPFVKYDTVFRNKRDIELWVTADQRHIPVLVRSAILIGSVEVALLDVVIPEIKGVGDKFESRLSP
jgi:hypothetical protein